MKPFKCILLCASLLLVPTAGPTLADTGDIPAEVTINREIDLGFGYRSFSLRNEAGRAGEYTSFTSSPTFRLGFFDDHQGNHLLLDANYQSDEDYNLQASYNRSGQLRLEMRAERFLHNLDHIPYDNGYTGDGNNRVLDHAPVDGSRPDGMFNSDVRTYYTDHNPGARYSQQLDVNEVKMRVKLPNYPAHINLAYWRLEKTGARQQRFVDENCTGCHMQSRTRNIDRVTDEIKAGIDAHLGYVDLSAEAVHREFRDREQIPVDAFGSHFRGRSAGNYEHAEDPDSVMTELTLRANTAPAGGLVGSASFTIGERENKSDLVSVGPVKAETDYYKTTADVTYSPGENWTVSMRYRLLDLDSDNSDVITAYAGGDANLDVREAIDYQRAWYEAIVNYRPTNRLTFKAELRREDIDRSGTGPAQAHHSGATDVQIDPYWELPSRETITRARLSFHSRMLEKSALKMNGWAMLRRSDDPAYGTSFSESREGFLSTSYSPSPAWGVTASANLLDETNDDRTVVQLYDDDGNSATAEAELPYLLGRDRTRQKLSLGGWLTPAAGLTFDVNFGYLRTHITQDLLFGAEPNPAVADANYTIRDDDVDYQQTVQTLAAGMNWQLREGLGCRLEGYLIRSRADYAPDFELPAGFFANGAGANSADLKEISKVDIRQQGVKGRLNWQIDKNWACVAEASYDNYDDMDSNLFDGSVISYMASFTRTW